MNLSQDVMSRLKDKWLDFCEANSYWLQEIKGTKASIATPDGGNRPNGFLILGVISGIEPEITNVIPVFLKLSGDSDSIIRALGLDFDPEVDIKKRAEERAKLPKKVPSEIDEIEKIRQQLSKGEI